MRIGNYDLIFTGNTLSQLSQGPDRWIDSAVGPLVRCGLVSGDDLDWSAPVALAVNEPAKGPAPLEAHLTITAREQELVLDLVLVNRGATPIGAVEFPCLGGLQTPPGARLTWPLMAGAEIPVDELAPDEVLEMGYPVYASMQWLDLFREDGRGLYLGMHDPAPHLKFLHAGRKAGKAWMSCEWFGLLIQPGERFAFPPVVLAAHDRFWYGGADIYRRWVVPQIHRRPMPDWVATEPTTVLTILKGHRAPKANLTFADLPHLARCARAAGAYTLHVAGYMENGHDTDYPRFVAGESMGGPEGLRMAGEQVREAGAALAFYSNGRLMDSTWPDPEEIHTIAVKQALWIHRRLLAMWDHMIQPGGTSWDPRSSFVTPQPAWNHDGRGATEGWGDIFGVCCPGSGRWRAILTDYLVNLVRDYQPKMLQVDQVCGCWSWACLDTAHDHARPSLAWATYRPFMRELREQLEAIDPELACWSEGVNDLLGESFDALQTNPLFTGLLRGHGRWEPALFQYTCPGPLLLANALNERTFDQLNLVLASRGFYFLEHEPFLTWAGNEDSPYCRYLTFALEVRKRHADLYTRGELLPVNACAPAGLYLMVHGHERQRLLVATTSGADSHPDKAVEYTLDLPACLAGARLAGQEKFRPDDPEATITSNQISWRGHGPLILRWETSDHC